MCVCVSHCAPLSGCTPLHCDKLNAKLEKVKFSPTHSSKVRGSTDGYDSNSHTERQPEKYNSLLCVQHLHTLYMEHGNIHVHVRTCTCTIVWLVKKYTMRKYFAELNFR